MNIDEKVMPWSRHPKQADEEEIASLKNQAKAIRVFKRKNPGKSKFSGVFERFGYKISVC